MRYPEKIYEAVGYYVDGRRAVACFATRADAEAFCRKNNDAIQADELWVEETACVDDYGWPLRRSEYARLRHIAICGFKR